MLTVLCTDCKSFFENILGCYIIYGKTVQVQLGLFWNDDRNWQKVQVWLIWYINLFCRRILLWRNVPTLQRGSHRILMSMAKRWCGDLLIQRVQNANIAQHYTAVFYKHFRAHDTNIAMENVYVTAKICCLWNFGPLLKWHKWHINPKSFFKSHYLMSRYEMSPKRMHEDCNLLQ